MTHPRLYAVALSLALDPPVVDSSAATESELPGTTGARDIEAPSDPPPDPLALHLELDLSKLPTEDAPYFERDIRAAIDPLLAREPVVLADDAAHRLVIHVRLLDPSALDYAIAFELLTDGSPIDPPLERLYCRTCPEVEVVEQVTQGLPRAFAALRAAVETPVPDAVVAIELSVPAEPSLPLVVAAPDTTKQLDPPSSPRSFHEPPTPPTPPPRIRWLGPVGAIGIVLALGGTTTVAVGTIALRQSWEHAPDPILQLPSFSRDPDATAWLLYGTGLAVTAIGGAMLAADVTALRERRARRLAARASLTPTHAGLVIHGRF